VIHVGKNRNGKALDFNSNFKSFSQTGRWILPRFKLQFLLTIIDKIYQEWWHFLLGRKKTMNLSSAVKHFCLSSGTSGAYPNTFTRSPKRWPSDSRTDVSTGCLRLSNYEELPNFTFQKRILMLGGSTELEFKWLLISRRSFRNHKPGRLPIVSALYKPGKKIFPY